GPSRGSPMMLSWAATQFTSSTLNDAQQLGQVAWVWSSVEIESIVIVTAMEVEVGSDATSGVNPAP
ncbi:MAG: hypothetical protein ACK517_04695, partial [bacterium]